VSVRDLSNTDLRALVRYGSERFSTEAQRELDERARSKGDNQNREMPVEAQANPFPDGRWT